jgi:hypothetical protein
MGRRGFGTAADALRFDTDAASTNFLATATVAAIGTSVASDPAATVAQMSSWQATIDTAKNLLIWGVGSWPYILAAGAVYVVVGHVLPAWAERKS